MAEEESRNAADIAEQTSRQLARQPRTMRELIQGVEFKNALGQLTRAIRPERFVRITLTALMREPKLANCSRESVFRALLDCSMYGLEPDGRRAHLVPYKNAKNNTLECKLILDYKGLAQLVRQAGDVRSLHADVVYSDDPVWSFEYGSNKHLRHQPALERAGKPIAYYSFVTLRDDVDDFMVLSPSEVEKAHKRSKAKDDGPWKTHYDDMGIKTAFRRHSKWLPLSEPVRDAVERDDDVVDAEIEEEPALLEPAPAGAGRKRGVREMARDAAAAKAQPEPEPTEGEEP